MNYFNHADIEFTRNVNQGQMLFGDGNLEHGVVGFEHQYICNKFCRWLGFNLKLFRKGIGRAKGLKVI